MSQRFALLAGLLLSGAAASAQTEYLDSTFNGTGRRTIALGPGMDWGAGAGLQRDAKIVVAGSSYDTKWRFAVTRLQPNGTTDATYGNGGKAFTSFGTTSSDQATAIVVDTSARAIVAGYSIDNSEEVYALARYKPNGQPDSTFDNDGIFTTTGFLNGRAKGLAVQMDGTITVCGSAVSGTTHHFGVLRLKANGVPENSFGNGGKVITMLPGTMSEATAIALQPDGKIVVAGSVATGAGWDFALFRYKVDGTPDPSFGSQGLIVTDLGTPDDMATSVLVQPDGKILVAGNIKTGGVNGYGMMRYLPNGIPDITFGSSGKVLSASGMPNAFVNTALLQSTGKILLAGQIDSAGLARFLLARYLPDGKPDSAFSGDGRIHTVIGTSHAYIMGAALQVDDKPVAVGWAWNGTANEFAIARYQPVPDVPVTGVSTVAASLRSIKVYPNPAGEQVTLTYLLDRSQRLTVQLTDGTGRILQTYLSRQLQAAGPHEQQLSLPAGLPSGVYYLTLSTPSGSESVKVLR